MTTDKELALERGTVDAINAALGAAQMSVAALAREIGRPYDSTRNYLTYERRLPMEILFAIAGALKVPADELVREGREKYMQKHLQ